MIDFTLARPLIRDELSLTVSYKDQSYSLSLGSFNIVPRASNTLNFNYLELHFKYLNNNLLPIGLTLELGEALELKSLALGKLQGDLTKISLNIPKTSIIEEIPTDGYKNNLLKPNERVFIPFKYEKLLLFQNYNLEIEADTNYFIDYSLGLLSFKRLKDFTGFIKEYGYD